MTNTSSGPRPRNRSLENEYPASVEKKYQTAIPTGRYTTAEEIASTVLFLCSDLAKNITGAQWVVDGGRTATGGAVTNLVKG